MSTLIVGVTAVIYVTPLHVYLIAVKKSRETVYFDIAVISFFVGFILYSLKTFGVLNESFITNYSMKIGVAIQSVLLSFGLADRINRMKRKIEKTEERYRNLVESSNDIIFSLDENLDFLTVNKAMKEHLGFRDEDVLGKFFLDFLHEASNERGNISKKIIEDYISNLKRNRREVSFRASLVTRHSHEPKEFTVKLEYPKFEGKEEIIGKASIIIDDVILKYLNKEKHEYVVENLLNYAEILSMRLTRNLNKYLDQSDILMLRVSVREIIINAMEHGNLNVQYEDKKNALEKDKYMKFIQERQQDSNNIKKNVHIEYSLNDDRVAYTITDEGSGFDHEGMMNRLSEKVLDYGNGLLAARNSFDVIKFNEKGNQVFLIKYFKDPATIKPQI